MSITEHFPFSSSTCLQISAVPVHFDIVIQAFSNNCKLTLWINARSVGAQKLTGRITPSYVFIPLLSKYFSTSPISIYKTHHLLGKIFKCSLENKLVKNIRSFQECQNYNIFLSFFRKNVWYKFLQETINFNVI